MYKLESDMFIRANKSSYPNVYLIFGIHVDQPLNERLTLSLVAYAHYFPLLQ